MCDKTERRKSVRRVPVLSSHALSAECSSLVHAMADEVLRPSRCGGSWDLTNLTRAMRVWEEWSRGRGGDLQRHPGCVMVKQQRFKASRLRDITTSRSTPPSPLSGMRALEAKRSQLVRSLVHLGFSSGQGTLCCSVHNPIYRVA
jgi:hypothetical protein